MKPLHDFAAAGGNAAVWQQFDSSVKAELWSTAIRVAEATYFFDPIDLAPAALNALLGDTRLAGIIITNNNHLRASAAFAGPFSVPVFAHADVELGQVTPSRIAEGDMLANGALSVIEVPGAARGEIAIHHSANDGDIVIGDALINFPPHGFSLLPAKYCTDPRQLRASLRKLLDLQFTRMFFAHGEPILSGARAKLEALLASR